MPTALNDRSFLGFHGVEESKGTLQSVGKKALID